jgi:glycosyltransferase involved in cell wall biosynthesis
VLKVRALIISPRASGVSGVGQHVRRLVKELLRRGHEVDLVCSEGTPHLKLRGLMNASFTASATLKLASSVPYPPAPYDVVHAHNIASALPMKAAWARRRILTLHGVFREQAPELHRWLPSSLARLLELKALSWADNLTAVSKEAVRKYSSMGFKVAYIPNAIDPSELPSSGLRLFDRQAVYVGRLSWEKGVDLLLEAFSKLPDVHLLVIGEGPEEARLKRLAKRMPNVHLLGPMPRAEALRHVKGSDILIQPSRREGLSTAVLEAMALGVPVVASSVGGNVELIIDGETGRLIPPNDPSSLASAVEELLNTPSRLKAMSVKARERVALEYSWRRVVEEYLKLYEGEA